LNYKIRNINQYHKEQKQIREEKDKLEVKNNWCKTSFCVVWSWFCEL